MVAFSLYGLALIAGSWLMLEGVAEAPLGYEDENGFHQIDNDEAAVIDVSHY